MSIVESLLRNTERHTCMQLVFTDGLERAEAEHSEIVALCRGRAFDDASALLAEHIRNAADTLISYINTQAGNVEPS